MSRIHDFRQRLAERRSEAYLGREGVEDEVRFYEGEEDAMQMFEGDLNDYSSLIKSSAEMAEMNAANERRLADLERSRKAREYEAKENVARTGMSQALSAPQRAEFEAWHKRTGGSYSEWEKTMPWAAGAGAAHGCHAAGMTWVHFAILGLLIALFALALYAWRSLKDRQRSIGRRRATGVGYRPRAIVKFGSGRAVEVDVGQGTMITLAGERVKILEEALRR